MQLSRNQWIASGVLGAAVFGVAGAAYAADKAESNRRDLAPAVTFAPSEAAQLPGDEVNLGSQWTVNSVVSALSPVSVDSAPSIASPLSADSPVSPASLPSPNSPDSPASLVSPASIDSPPSPPSA